METWLIVIGALILISIITLIALIVSLIKDFINKDEEN